jgi:hypothetical protein
MHFGEEPLVANQLYEFTMKVKPGLGCDLDPKMTGAYVPSYVAAPDYQAAITKAVTIIRSMHFVFDDIQGPAREVSIGTWDQYVARVWPEFADRLPSKDELPALVEEGAVFFGPFAGF